jgi:hypothetical protein
MSCLELPWACPAFCKVGNVAGKKLNNEPHSLFSVYRTHRDLLHDFCMPARLCMVRKVETFVFWL